MTQFGKPYSTHAGLQGYILVSLGEMFLSIPNLGHANRDDNLCCQDLCCHHWCCAK
jgi:hypothetical protein